MKDTRVQLLADIMLWAESPNAPVVLWLNGLAGTGKSTIARTLCDRLAKKDLLVASFFISGQENRSQAPDVVRTIAYQIARNQRVVADEISQTLQGSPDLALSEGLRKLSDELLFKPARVLETDAGLLVVIDAMDECREDKDGRPGGDLLLLLLQGLQQLSRRVKLLITSRPESKIHRMFQLAGAQYTVMELHDPDRDAVVRSDIRLYLDESFARIVERHYDLNLRNWPSLGDMDVLVDRAGVLFVFAATVVEFVGTLKQNPRERLDIVLARRDGNLGSPYRFLDQLYMQVLETSIRSEHKEDERLLCQILRTVLGSIVATRKHLTVAAHAVLLTMNCDNVRRMVESLSALLLCPQNRPVSAFHPSFPDFIVSSERCSDPRFLVSLKEHHLRLARGCLGLLNGHLRYNMANAVDPDVANSDIEDLRGRLIRAICQEGNHNKESLPEALFYAARYWTTHVVSSEEKGLELMDALTRFCDDHLFHWLELLSLIEGLGYSVQSSLLEVVLWLEVRCSSPSPVPAHRSSSASLEMSGCLRLASY
jgi:hypothetical protein